MIPSTLVVGGSSDPNITALLQAFERAVVPVRLLDTDGNSRIEWSPGGSLYIDGDETSFLSVFVRNDVFGPAGDPTLATVALSWTTAIVGWLLACPSIRTPNRAMWSVAPSKPHALTLAAELGLPIPATLITNDREAARAFCGCNPKIAKPICGGDLARPLEEAMSLASRSEGPFAAPAVVQERLVPPEVRVYVVGDRTFAFEIRSHHLDYRAANDAEVVMLDVVPQGITKPLCALARAVGLDFCAADFKAGSDGRLKFLEVNSAPMFSRFDHASDGVLADALMDWLSSQRRAHDSDILEAR